VGSESADFVTQVENTVKAEPGQMVSLEMGESNILLASFVSYFIPFLGFLAGTALTAWLLPGNELRLFLGGLAGIGLVYLVVHYWYQPRVAKKGFVKIEIKRVI
jgi:positive regulator of sigma E activity